MSFQPNSNSEIPEATARTARKALSKGNVYIKMRDEFGTLFKNEEFASLYPAVGHRALASWQLNMVCIMQFIEGLSDRQAAEAVRDRLSWKYALGLELDDEGFDFSVLSEHRDRLIRGGAESKLLESMLELFEARGLLKARGRQRSDSTHVLAAVRNLNRLEMVGETMRAALDAVASEAPDWLRRVVPSPWYKRYGTRVMEYRLPKEAQQREMMGEQIGRDGFALMELLYAAGAPDGLADLQEVEILRQIWVQQYYRLLDPAQEYLVVEHPVQWRKSDNVPPAAKCLVSPRDPDAHFGNKRGQSWLGYKDHDTETCDEDRPNIITDGQTTSASVPDVEVTGDIQENLHQRNLLPAQHLVDTGYVDAEHLVRSQRDYAIELVGPVKADSSWQARQDSGFDISQFKIDWERHRVECPGGKLSQSWLSRLEKNGHETTHVRFDKVDCQACPHRCLCTSSADRPRGLTLNPKEEHLAFQEARQRQQTPAWKELYNCRSGIEGTISQEVRVCDLRHARYIGLQKTHLQHIFSLCALNYVRVAAWLFGKPRAKSRTTPFAALAA